MRKGKAVGGEASQQTVIEVGTGRRGRNGSRLFCVDCLIAFFIFFCVVTFHIRRQRHMADVIKQVQQRFVGCELQMKQSPITTNYIDSNAVFFTTTKIDRLTRLGRA